MSHELHTTEGVILRSIPFRDSSKIITLFTEDVGIIKVFYNTRTRDGGAPLTKVELIYRERSGDIFSAYEMTPIDYFPHLRKELHTLQAAAELLEIIQTSQWLGKSAPRLYSLLCFYLNKISFITDPNTLTSSFKLKLLVHDGLLHLPFLCSLCGEPLHNEAYGIDSDMRCTSHHLAHQSVWSKDELALLAQLTFSESYKAMAQIHVPDSLKKKIDTLFANLLA